ncbi:MAG: inositol monophosphatase [Pseudomonadota bacterium]
MTQLNNALYDELIEAVRAASRTAIMPRFRNLDPAEISEKNGPTDLVTIADQEAEAQITAAAQALMPDALIVGEEAVEDDPSLLDQLAGADLAVIIDPVDGTWNFAAGLSVFGVIVAVVEKGETVFGLLYDPVMDDWVRATKGQGAWFCKPNGQRERLPGPKPTSEDAVHAYVSTFLFPKETRPLVTEAMAPFARATSLRCSCQEYRMFALGHVDLVVAAWAKPWDHAAGVLVAAECGADVMAGGTPGYDPAHPMPPVVIVQPGQEWAEGIDWAAFLS